MKGHKIKTQSILLSVASMLMPPKKFSTATGTPNMNTSTDLHTIQNPNGNILVTHSQLLPFENKPITAKEKAIG